MASEVALGALEGLPTGSSILDPMCGSGVVIRRALDAGHVALGIDIDPLAVLMAKIWTGRIPPSIKTDFGWKIACRASSKLDSSVHIPWIDCDQDTTAYIDFWFAKSQRNQIRALLAATLHLRGMRRDLVNLALSRIIVTKSNGASLAADTSHSRPHKVRTDNDFDVLSGFAKSFERLIRLLRKSPVQYRGKVRRGDARTLRGIRSESIDAVITSPPYINAIDYLRGHKLALVWLGYSIPRIRDINSLSVGATTRNQRRDSDSLRKILRVASVDGLPHNVEQILRRYVHDMLKCLKQSHRVLRPRGYAVYVVSNSVMRGIEVDTAKILTEVASTAGFQLKDQYIRAIPREHRYLPPPESTDNRQLAARMRTESVLRFAKY